MKKYKKSGQPPGSLFFVGDRKMSGPYAEFIRYNDKGIFEKHSCGQKLEFELSDVTTNWLKTTGLHDVAFLDNIGKKFNIHPLIMEDIANTQHNPKIDFYEDQIFVVLKSVDYSPEHLISEEHVSFLLGRNYVLSFEESEPELFDKIIEQLSRAEAGRIVKSGTDFLMYQLMDAVVDHYFDVLNSISEDLENLELELVKNATNATLQRISAIKKNLLLFYRSIFPLRDVVRGLMHEKSNLIQDSTDIYFKDLYDHISQIFSTLDTMREMATNIFEVYHSVVSNRMNEVIKMLTILSTIFMPLTFIVGVYGMNFKEMPEMGWPYSYYVVWSVMILITLGMLKYFRIKKWI